MPTRARIPSGSLRLAFPWGHLAGRGEQVPSQSPPPGAVQSPRDTRKVSPIAGKRLDKLGQACNNYR